MSKKFTLQFVVENEAFQPEPEAQIAFILREVADRIQGGDSFDMHRNIKDENGNVIGTFVLKNNQE